MNFFGCLALADMVIQKCHISVSALRAEISAASNSLLANNKAKKFCSQVRAQLNNAVAKERYHFLERAPFFKRITNKPEKLLRVLHKKQEHNLLKTCGLLKCLGPLISEKVKKGDTESYK